MPLLTYAIAEAAQGAKAELFPVSFPPVADGAWQHLADSVAGIKTITPFPARVLFNRWRQGYAAVAISHDEIVAYISCQPILFQATRQKLSEILGLDCASLPAIDAYEFLTGWTHPAWRRRDISLQLRRQLMAHLEEAGRLFISVTVGLGASPVSAKLGWQVVPWSEIAFVTSMIRRSAADCPDGEPGGWPVPGHRPYEEQCTPPLQNAGQEWEGFCYFWVSNSPLSVELDRELAALVDGDLRRWQDVWQAATREVLLDMGWLPVIFQE